MRYRRAGTILRRQESEGTMATLAQRTRSLEERTDRLETIIVTLSQEAAQDREESARFREEWRLQAAQDREESARDRE